MNGKKAVKNEQIKKDLRHIENNNKIVKCKYEYINKCE